MPSVAGASSPAAALAEALDNSARLIDRHLQDDRCFPDLSELLSVPSHSKSEFLSQTSEDRRNGRVWEVKTALHTNWDYF